MPDKEPTLHLLYWEAPWAPPPEVIRVHVNEGSVWMEISQGVVAPRSVRLELTAEQAQAVAMKLHEAAIRMTMPAQAANAIATQVRDLILDASGQREPFWFRRG